MSFSGSASACSAPSATKIKRVFITGGTHCNEACGVVLAKHFMASPELFSGFSFDTTVMLTNVASIGTNTRYVEEDMNRCFFKADLDDPTKTATLEARRAKELNAVFGPKGTSAAADFIIDLHNTTAATGVALMMSPTDELGHAIAAHLIALDPSVKVCNWNATQADWPMLPSVGKHGMTLEVGPVPWGVVDGAVYKQTRRLVLAALDYVEAHNAALARDGPWSSSTVQVHSFVRSVDYPRDASGELAGVIHPQLQGRDFGRLARGDPAFLALDGQTTIPYTAPEEEVEELFPFFINEAAYYEKKTAFMLARRIDRPVQVAKQSPQYEVS